MTRWFWRLYWPLFAAVLVAYQFGGAIEGRLWPIRVNQVLHDVVRTPGRLCWTWESDKLRQAASDNTDVFLDTADGDRSYPEVFNGETNQPWHKLGMLPTGHHALPLCILLPARIGMTEPVTVRLVVHYRGLLGLWTVLVPLPDVVSKPPG